MTVFLGVAAGVFALLTITLTVKIYAMKKSARELADCFSFAANNDTNAGVTLSSRDKDMLKLATALDECLKSVRRARLTYDNGSWSLKKRVTDISHDLRTPLTVISGYMEMLAQEDKSATAGEYLDIIANRIEAMKKLTEELFDYSYATSYDEPPVALDLKQELEASLLDFYAAFTQKNIEPKISMPEQKIMREVDRSKVRRIFSNIISNVVKHGDGDFSVTASQNGTIVFCNAASGLDALSAAKLFDRYYTVNGGTHSGGIGLAIARELAQDLGGSLDGMYDDGKLYITLKL